LAKPRCAKRVFARRAVLRSPPPSPPRPFASWVLGRRLERRWCLIFDPRLIAATATTDAFFLGIPSPLPQGRLPNEQPGTHTSGIRFRHWLHPPYQSPALHPCVGGPRRLYFGSYRIVAFLKPHSRELPRRVQGFSSDSTHINFAGPPLCDRLIIYVTSSPPHGRKGDEHPLHARVFPPGRLLTSRGGTEAAARKGASAF
jgi:hypothetical protein